MAIIADARVFEVDSTFAACIPNLLASSFEMGL
jgi:hypothetical protein